METNDFYEFDSKLIASTIQAHATELDKVKNETSDHNKLIRGQYGEITFPVIFKQEYGKNLKDILNTGWPSLYLISDRMKSILEENFLTGWQCFPIKLYDKSGKEISGYYGFSIVGRCGPIDYTKSEIIEIRKFPTGPLCQYYKGLFFDKWDKNDFFIPENTTFIFITKNAADILKKNKITNIQLEKLAEIEMDVRAVKLNT